MLKKKLFWILLVVVIILLIGVVYFVYQTRLNKSANVYEAVFLNNGQVYFGKVVGGTRDSLKLTDVFYLQVNQGLQDQKTNNQNQPDVNLVKLGSEMHGPKDEMKITKSNILFIEELSSTSKVLKAIEEYKSK